MTVYPLGGGGGLQGYPNANCGTQRFRFTLVTTVGCLGCTGVWGCEAMGDSGDSGDLGDASTTASSLES